VDSTTSDILRRIRSRRDRATSLARRTVTSSAGSLVHPTPAWLAMRGICSTGRSGQPIPPVADDRNTGRRRFSVRDSEIFAPSPRRSIVLILSARCPGVRSSLHRGRKCGVPSTYSPKPCRPAAGKPVAEAAGVRFRSPARSMMMNTSPPTRGSSLIRLSDESNPLPSGDQAGFAI